MELVTNPVHAIAWLAKGYSEIGREEMVVHAHSLITFVISPLYGVSEACLAIGLLAGVAVLKQVWSQPGGLAGLWRGALPMMLVVPLQNSLLFAGYGMGCRTSKDEGDKECKPSKGSLFATASPGTGVSPYSEMYTVWSQCHHHSTPCSWEV